ncbi:MAG: hypothetical protein FJ224_09300 [Lentisphaerae bacterium]|nr:hypothetical protein [Lentisphaerota bacterium]
MENMTITTWLRNTLRFAGLALTSAFAADLWAGELADLVDPRIGVIGVGSTVIGPAMPHGSIHPSPDTPNGGNDGYDPEQPIRGFSQFHASGTGWGRYGNLLISPQIGLAVKHTKHDSPKAEEKATAYSYQVRLTTYDILAELAPTRNAAIYRFTFPASDDAHLMLDLAHSIPGDINRRIGGSSRDSVIAYDPTQRCFTGSSTYSGGWGGGRYTVYFYAELDQAPSAFGTWKNDQIDRDRLSEQWTTKGDRVGGWCRFSTRAGQAVQLKLGVSFRSVERARDLLKREIPGWDYKAVCDAGRQAWNEALGRIAVDGGSETQRVQFYTALYHAHIMPRDRTGEFERFPADAPMWDDHYAIWDTWRTKYPLMMSIQPDMVRGSIASFAERLRVDGQVRDSFTAGWGGSGNRDQGGNDVDNIIADAYVKGLQGVDWVKAYAVLKFNADKERKGNVRGDDYQRRGWIRGGMNSNSDTLEYAYNDFAIAQVARGLGKEADAARYFARARQWQNLFNPAKENDGFTGFIMPRADNGTWVDVDVQQQPGSWKLYFYGASGFVGGFRTGGDVIVGCQR